MQISPLSPKLRIMMSTRAKQTKNILIWSILRALGNILSWLQQMRKESNLVTEKKEEKTQSTKENANWLQVKQTLLCVNGTGVSKFRIF